jgi:hypothetical protein
MIVDELLEESRAFACACIERFEIEDIYFDVSPFDLVRVKYCAPVSTEL